MTKTPGYAPKTNRRRERRNVLAKKLAGISRLFWVRVYACSTPAWALGVGCLRPAIVLGLPVRRSGRLSCLGWAWILARPCLLVRGATNSC
nr:MAG TPA: hypothetical protein [Caudoviricetes sp.]